MDTNTTFWSTGITLTYHPRTHNFRWSAEVLYRDNNTFTQEVAVEGRITTQLGELNQVIDRMMEAVQALGIVWRTDIPGSPALYLEIEDDNSTVPEAMRQLARRKAAAIGWTIAD
jgi:hypothetical protein